MEIPQYSFNVIIGLSIIVGLIQCFLGYRIFKIVLGITGFFVGSSIIYSISYGLFQPEIISILLGLIGGLVGASLMVTLFYMGVFFIGALLGVVLGNVFFSFINESPYGLILIVIAAIFGFIALLFQRFMIVLSTGIGGAWLVVNGIAYFVTGEMNVLSINKLFRYSGSHIYTLTLYWFILGITGIVVQYRFILHSQKLPK